MDLASVNEKNCEAWSACFTISKGVQGVIIASAENPNIQLTQIDDGDLVQIIPEQKKDEDTEADQLRRSWEIHEKDKEGAR